MKGEVILNHERYSIGIQRGFHVKEYNIYCQRGAKRFAYKDHIEKWRKSKPKVARDRCSHKENKNNTLRIRFFQLDKCSSPLQ